MLAGGEKERQRKREGGKLPSVRERDQFQDLLDVPLMSWKSRFAGPLDLACLKSLPADVGFPTSYHSPKGQSLAPLHEVS
jgi:hypothetical protein